MHCMLPGLADFDRNIVTFMQYYVMVALWEFYLYVQAAK